MRRSISLWFWFLISSLLSGLNGGAAFLGLTDRPWASVSAGVAIFLALVALALAMMAISAEREERP